MTTATIARARMLLTADRPREAASLCATALARAPHDAALMHLLALAEHKLGDHALAIERLCACLAARPREAAIHADLGRMLALDDRTAEALPAFRRATELAPADGEHWHNLARCLRQSGAQQEAFAAVTTALRHAPDRADSLMLLGEILLDDDQVDKAITCLELAAERAPQDAEVHKELARVLAKRGLLDRADAAYRAALALAPEDADAWFALASVAEDRGDVAAAEHGYRRSVALDPGQGYGLGRLLALVGTRADEALVARAEAALDAPAIPDEAKALVGYGLGKTLEARGAYDDAFAAYAAANAARRRKAGAYDRAQATARLQRLIAEPRDADPPGSDSDLPVFVVGMPRSGTTLVEQILSMHPAVHGAGELTGIAQASDALAAGGSDLQREAATYLALLTRDAAPGVVRAIDKAPLNFFKLGLIARLFPRARVIHCTRDPRDICWSIFAENFAATQTYATDLADLAFFWRQQDSIMEHWRAALPLPIRTFVYEETVADVRATAEALCDFLDVPWNERCVAFHTNDRAVRTPSRWQVRRPIYATSHGRWRRFERHLGPLLAALPPLD